jgi:hypothetical protein
MEVNKKYYPRKYKEKDEKQIVNLLKLVFGDWPQTDYQGTAQDHWKWKYLDYPSKYNNTVVAESEGKVIGAMHGTTHKVKVGDSIYDGQVGSDVAVHPNYRRLGVFTSMRKLKNKQHFEYGYNIMYWQTSNPILLESKWEGRKIKTFSHPLLSFVRIHDVDKHLKYNKYDESDIILKYGYLGSRILDRFKHRKTLRKNDKFEVREVNFFDFEINTFWDNIKNDYNFIVKKTMLYLNWRYCDSRGGRYKVILAQDKNNILGYIVYRINRFRKDYPIGLISEVLARSGRIDVVERLLHEAVQRLDTSDVNVIHAKIIKGHIYESILKKCGFVDSRKKNYVGFSPHDLQDDLEKLVNAYPDRIHFQLGETEQF